MLHVISRFSLFTFLLVLFSFSITDHTDAAVCVAYSYGECVFWVGSVEASLTADDLGDIIKDPKSIGFEVTPKGPGLLYCKHPCYAEPRVVRLDAEIVKKIGTFGGMETIKRKDVEQCCEDKGTALVNVSSELNGAQLWRIGNYCEEMKLKPVDFVPINFEVEVFLIDENTKRKIDSENYECKLPNWEKLEWRKNKPEQRPYQCEKIK